MIRNSLLLALILIALSAAGGVLWVQSSHATSKRIVGVWFVRFPAAPFKYHMMAFHEDGTLEQANPDAGDAHSSDSDGMGIWEMRSGKIVGKFVEITADRESRQFVSRGEISFTVDLDGDAFTGTATGRFYDLDNKQIVGPVNTDMNGSRIKL